MSKLSDRQFSLEDRAFSPANVLDRTEAYCRRERAELGVEIAERLSYSGQIGLRYDHVLPPTCIGTNDVELTTGSTWRI